MSIVGLLSQIRDDEIVLPAIQRNFVWSEDKIAKLLDSILRDYPIGIALLWETYLPLQYRTFTKEYRPDTLASFKDNESGKRLRVVLDGQQRMQSLYIALFGSFEGRELCFDVLSGKDHDEVSDERFIFEFFDAEQLAHWNDYTKQQLTRPEGERDHDFYLWYYVKVSELFKMSPTSREKFCENVAGVLNLGAEDRTRLRVNLAVFDGAMTRGESLQLSIIDHEKATDSPERKTEADVLEIFVRINREGTPLNRSDLIFSMLKLNWKESAEALPDFVQGVNKGHSFGLTDDFVIRCLFAVSDLGAKFDLNLLRNRKNVQTLRHNFDGCCDAIRATVDFLTQHCWIQSDRLLGSRNVLVPLVYYFFHTKRHRIPHAQIPRARQAVYWFAFSRALSRYGDSRVGAFIRDALQPLSQAADESFPLEKVVDWVSRWQGVSGFGPDLLRGNIDLALHVVQGLTGAQLQYEGNYPEVDHIFPRSTLREKGFDEAITNHFANFWILAREKNRNKSDTDPANYFKDVPDEEMQRALIERERLKFSQYRAFIASRSERMLEKIREKLGFSKTQITKVTE